jgi:hypothetical protein
MNPTVPESFLKREQARDPENYKREYEAEFTEAISSFLPVDSIDACVVQDRGELPPNREKHHYCAAVDAAYKGDKFTLCVAHLDRVNRKVAVDVLAGWQGSKQVPLRLAEVMPQIHAICQKYGIYRVLGDQFGAEPLKDAFTRHHLAYEERTFTNQSKADIYATLRTRIMDGTIELLDHRDSLRELRGLELENLPGGGIRIGHARHVRSHDDYADAMALAVSEASQYIEAASPLAAGERESYKLLADYRLYSEGYRPGWDRY